MNNPNKLKIGDRILIETAWEDDAGHYHSESALITGIDDKGELSLDFDMATDEIREFLKDTDSYMAKDFNKE